MTPQLERLLAGMLSASDDESRILSLYSEFLRSCGLTHFTLGLFLSERAAGSTALDDRVPIWTSMPDDWMEEYNSLGYREHDYVIDTIVKNSGNRSSLVFSWGEDSANESDVTKETQIVLRGAGDAGLAQAVTFYGKGYPDADIQQFAASLGSDEVSREEVIRRIEARRNELVIASFAMAPHLRPAAERRRRDVTHLTPREKDVLGRFAQGLRVDRIADAMGISNRTVNMHAKNVRRKLKARTMAEAAAIAIRCGLL